VDNIGSGWIAIYVMDNGLSILLFAGGKIGNVTNYSIWINLGGK